jgi:hypothetical protein
MPISTKIKSIYSAVVILVQIYFVYAATLYIDVHSTAMLCVIAVASASAVATLCYIFVLANKDEVGGYNAQFTLEERRRIG